MNLLNLFLVFMGLSLLAFGGGNAILPEMQHQVVAVHHWLSAEQFGTLFAIAQAAPGPNMMIVPLIGWYVAGMPGLLVASLAKLLPSSLLTAYAIKFLDRFKGHALRIRIEMALKPITVGLVLVSAWLIAEVSAQNIYLLVILLIATALNYFRNVHPFWIMVLGSGLAVLLL